MIIATFLDESGKFKDNSTVSLAAVSGNVEDINSFGEEWKRHLRLNGLRVLTMKQALNHNRRLSEKRPAVGIDNRIHTLLPFAETIRKYLQHVAAVAVDVQAFKNTPDYLRKVWSDDPYFLAFARILIEVMRPLGKRDHISIVCDDEEFVAPQVLRLYRRVRIIYEDARCRLASLSFADDNVFVPLQAADFLASIIRMEAARHFYGKDYDYRPLWYALNEKHDGDRLWELGAVFCGHEQLRRISERRRVYEQRVKGAGQKHRSLAEGS